MFNGIVECIGSASTSYFHIVVDSKKSPFISFPYHAPSPPTSNKPHPKTTTTPPASPQTPRSNTPQEPDKTTNIPTPKHSRNLTRTARHFRLRRRGHIANDRRCRSRARGGKAGRQHLRQRWVIATLRYSIAVGFLVASRMEPEPHLAASTTPATRSC